MVRLAAAIIAAALFASAMTTDSEARIRCNKGFQAVPGAGEIATPYCEDEYVAQVARSYGVGVSGRTIRNNPNKKEEVCRMIGHDSRVYEACAKYKNDGCRGKDC